MNVIDEMNEIIGISKSQEFDIWTLVKYNYIKQPTTFFRRKIIDNLIGVNEDLHYIMDHEFWLRIGLSDFKLRYLPGLTYANFRKCPGTKSYEYGSKFQKEFLIVVEQIIQNPTFDYISQKEKKSLICEKKSLYLFSEFLISLQNKEIIKSIKFLSNSIKTNRRILLEIGLWYRAILALQGKKFDWRKKYK